MPARKEKGGQCIDEEQGGGLGQVRPFAPSHLPLPTLAPQVCPIVGFTLFFWPQESSQPACCRCQLEPALHFHAEALTHAHPTEHAAPRSRPPTLQPRQRTRARARARLPIAAPTSKHHQHQDLQGHLCLLQTRSRPASPRSRRPLTLRLFRASPTAPRR